MSDGDKDLNDDCDDGDGLKIDFDDRLKDYCSDEGLKGDYNDE